MTLAMARRQGYRWPQPDQRAGWPGHPRDPRFSFTAPRRNCGACPFNVEQNKKRREWAHHGIQTGFEGSAVADRRGGLDDGWFIQPYFCDSDGITLAQKDMAGAAAGWVR